jgi:hypothetical protein
MPDNDFYCEYCNYKTYKKFNMELHYNTKKHKKNILITNTEFPEKTNKKTLKCQKCEKEFNDRPGLWRHNKKCKKEDENNSELTDKQMIEYLVKENNFLKSVYSKLIKNENNI